MRPISAACRAATWKSWNSPAPVRPENSSRATEGPSFPSSNNPRRAPQRIGVGDPTDEVAYLLADQRAAALSQLCSCAPVIAEAFALPRDDSLRLNEELTTLSRPSSTRLPSFPDAPVS